MTDHLPNLVGTKIGVIGFNARPIAASLKKQGAETYVADYWGDADLKGVSTKCIAVLSPTPGVRQRQSLDVPLYQALIDNFHYLTQDIDIDSIIIGSGFDDYSDSLSDLEQEELIIGNTIASMKKSRDFTLLKKLIDDKDCNLPARRVVTDIDSEIERLEPIDFPLIVRPLHSGGGSGIRLIRSKSELRKHVPIQKEQSPFVFQEYIKGLDFSCSVLSTGSEAKAISVQGQLIGMPSAGRNCDFAYCGNYLPSGLQSKILKQITAISEMLAVQLELKGSNGFDFVVSKEKIWLMEINPRIQGTLEMLELAGDISITKEHFQSVNSVLFDRNPEYTPSVKMILYSRYRGKLPDLNYFPDVYDKSPSQVIVNRGDPICTIIKHGNTIVSAYHKTIVTAREIQQKINPLT